MTNTVNPNNSKNKSGTTTLPTNPILICAALVVVLAGIKVASVIIVPMLLSVFFAIICSPIIKFGTSIKIPRSISIAFIIISAILLGTAFASIVGNSINEFSMRLPEYKLKLTYQFNWLMGQFANFDIQLNSQSINDNFNPGVAMGLVSNLLSSLSGVMTNIFLILLSVIFMLTEADSFPKKIRIALNNADDKLERLNTFMTSVNRYLAIKTAVSICTGLLAGFLCWFMEVNHFVLWGVLAFLFNFIPNVGSLAAAIPPVMLAIIEIGLTGATIVGGGYILINTLMGNAIEPRFMGKGLGLSALVVFLSLVFWGWLLGTVGMLLSIPLTMIVKIGLEGNPETRWVSMMLSAPEQKNV